MLAGISGRKGERKISQRVVTTINKSPGFWNQHLGDFVFDIVLSESAINIGLKDN
jgi:hypothetical protein